MTSSVASPVAVFRVVSWENCRVLRDTLLRPLDLEAALEAADVDGSRDAVIDLLVAALTDPRARGDDGIEGYVDTLIEACRDAGREPDAIETLRVIAGLEPDLAGTLTVEIACLHADLDEDAAAVDVLTQGLAEQQRRPAAERGLNFYGRG